MKEEVIDLTNAQVGDKFIRVDGEVVTVVYKYYDLALESDRLVMVDKCDKGAIYTASKDGYPPVVVRLIKQVDVPQMPAPGVPNPQAEGAGVPFSGTNESDMKLDENLGLSTEGIIKCLADSKKDARIARRERIALEIVRRMDYISSNSLKELIDDIEDAIVDIDEVKIAAPDTL